jgi:ceramide glucosyltransferase
MILYWASIISGLLALLGCGYLVGATILTHRFRSKAPTRLHASTVGVTILKPLHGEEPGLFENLASFCTQDYPGPVQIVFGVQDPGDGAIAIVERLRAEHGTRHLDLVIDATMHGLNHKVSNLVNMWRHAEHDIVIVADSDMRVDSGYLSRVVAELEEGDAAAMTCLYHGLAATGIWARLATLGINAHFLPSVIVGLGLGLAQPCFGSTIAIRRRALDEIGGFIGVADCLADDYALGAALRARGHKISVSPVTIGHVCAEMSVRELWQHEVRWGRTIRSIDPVGYAGSVLTHAFPLALIAALTGLFAQSPTLTFGIGLVFASFGCRLALLREVERGGPFDLPAQSYWLIGLRDLLSFAVFVTSLFGRNARWKGRRYTFRSGGTLVVAGSSSTP